MTGGSGGGPGGAGRVTGGPDDQLGARRPTALDRDEAALELARIRDRIDELDRRIVALLNERAVLGRAAGRAKRLAGRRAVKDPEREREVLLRVAMGNPGPLSQPDLLSIYRRVVSATRVLESRDRGIESRDRGIESRDRGHDGRSGG